MAYFPLNRLEISAEQLRANYGYLKEIMPVAPVLKSNAYGHGLALVAKTLDPLKSPFFCVDSLFEAYELKKASISTPILIMGFVHPESLAVRKLPFAFAVWSDEQVAALVRYQPKASLHIFVDTGMHREGMRLAELPSLLEKISKTTLRVEGLMTHFGKAEAPEEARTGEQVRAFGQAQKLLQERGISPRWIHASASAALLRTEQFGVIGNVARAGIALYGYNRVGHTALRPALSFKTRVAQVKKLQKGEALGYDFTFTASQDMRVAVLPIGYHDGLDRRLSHCGSVSIERQECPILGRVSMNITMIDVTALPEVKVGQEAVVFSADPAAANSIEKAAEQCQTISYDLLVGLHASTKRSLTHDHNLF